MNNLTNYLKMSLDNRKFTYLYLAILFCLSIMGIYYQNKLAVIISTGIYLTIILKAPKELISPFIDPSSDYRSREIFLFPLSQNQLIKLVLIEEFLATAVMCGVIIPIFFIIFSKINKTDNLGIYAYVLVFVLIMLTKVGMHFYFKFQNLSFAIKAIRGLRYILIMTFIPSILLASFALAKIFNITLTLGSGWYFVYVFVFLVSSIFLYEIKMIYFNEHLAFRRIKFSPLVDTTMIVILLLGVWLVKKIPDNHKLKKSVVVTQSVSSNPTQ